MQTPSASQQPCPPVTPGMWTKSFLSPAADNDGWPWGASPPHSGTELMTPPTWCLKVFILSMYRFGNQKTTTGHFENNGVITPRPAWGGHP